MFFIFKIEHFKKLIYVSIIFILSNCQFKEPIKGHGINFLLNRSEKILVNESNKNDVINVLGNPHTTSLDDENLCAEMFLFNPSSTTFVKHYLLRSVQNSAINYVYDSYSAGYGNTTSAIDAVQFKAGSGNIDSGTIKLYGIKDS